MRGLDACCEETLREMPEAALCGSCTLPIPRCTGCGRAVGGSGLCGGCVAVRAEIETQGSLAEGRVASVGLRLENASSRPVWVDEVRWRAVGTPVARGEAIQARLDAGARRECALSLETSGVDRLALDLTVVAGPSRRDLHELGAHALFVGSVRAASPTAGGIHIHGDLRADYGGVVKFGDLGERPGSREPEGPSWRPVALAPLPSTAGGTGTAVVDRRTRILWTDPDTGEPLAKDFARRPWLVCGRDAGAKPKPGQDRADLAWRPPADLEECREVASLVSRSHALLFVRSGRLWIQDLGTMNGTSVNRRALEGNEERVLRHGDVIAPWGDCESPEFAPGGVWQVVVRGNAGGFAGEVAFRHRRETE